MNYQLGPVQPWVADVANTVGPALGVSNIGGWRATGADMSGHPAGLALDFQVGSTAEGRAKGDKVAAYFVANAQPLAVKYVIWRQRIWRPGVGWKSMEYRPGDAPGYDPNHMRHVHVSFLEEVASGKRLAAPKVKSGQDGLPWWTVITPIGGAAAAVGWVQNFLGDVTGDVIDAVSSPLDAVGQLMSRSTWMRVGQVLGGAGLITVGIVVLIMSSDAAGKAGQLLALAPTPATKAAGVAIAAADKIT